MKVQRFNEPSAWCCDLCCEGYISGVSTTIDNTQICSPCIQQLFETSIASEASFPPRWGSKVLDIWDFRHAINTAFLARFDKKADEWTCPPKERIYCRHTDPPRRQQECSAFLGRRTDNKLCRQCDDCRWYTCLCCLECFSTSDISDKETRISHHCDPAVEEELRKQAFQGLKRGKDYQDCPNPKCERRVELKDGCNSMRCPSCGTEYCYVCGRKALHDSGHWREGSPCPKWNQPGTKEATYYDSEGDSEEESETDDEELTIQLELLQTWRQHRPIGPSPTKLTKEHARNSARNFQSRARSQRQLTPMSGRRPGRLHRAWDSIRGRKPSNTSHNLPSPEREAIASDSVRGLAKANTFPTASLTTAFRPSTSQGELAVADESLDFRLSLLFRDSTPQTNNGRCHTCNLPLTECCCGTTRANTAPHIAQRGSIPDPRGRSKNCPSCNLPDSRCQCGRRRAQEQGRRCSCAACTSRKAFDVSGSESSFSSEESGYDGGARGRYRRPSSTYPHFQTASEGVRAARNQRVVSPS